MSVSAVEVKELRERTGAGLMDCKKALQEANGDQERAMLVLRERGVAKAEKKRSRTANEGIISHYIHADGKIGVMVELNCETDFVAQTDDFQELGREICMQIAAMDPMAVKPDDIPDDVIEQEKTIYRQQAEGKPDHVIDKIVEGKLESFYEANCLLQQPWIRDNSLKIKDLIDEKIAKLGEKIKVKRFVKFEVGEEDDS
jgi:elongation factor Ts